MYKIKLSPYANIFYTEWLLEPASGRYNLSIDQTLHGNLDVNRLKTALTRYIKEHLLLNSHIQTFDTLPHWVQNEYIKKLEYSEIPLSTPEISDYISHAFDLYSEPLYRFLLVRLDDNVYRFIIVMHHLVMDGSAALDTGVFDAISNYYNNDNYTNKYSLQKQIKLITDLTEALTINLQQRQTEYTQFWRKQLAELDKIDLDFLKLNKNYSDQKHTTDSWDFIGKFEFDCTKSERVKLNQIKLKYGITPYLYSLNIFAITLYLYTNQTRLALSYPITIKEGVDFIFGAQINTNLIPYQFNKNITISELFNFSANFFKITVKDGVKYGYCPVTDIIRETKNKELLNICFTHTYFRENKFAFRGIKKTDLHDELTIDGIIPNILLLEQNARNSKNNLTLRIRYDKRIISEELLCNFGKSYKKIFSEILNDVTAGKDSEPVTNYNLLHTKQYNKIIYKFNQTDHQYPHNKTIHALFEEQVLKTPNNIAVVYEDKKLTYEELNQKANQLAYYLKTNYKITTENLIALCLDRNEYILITLLGVLKAGGAYVPIDVNYPNEKINHILSDTQAKVIITNSNHKNRLQQIYKFKNNIIAIDSEEILVNLAAQKNINPQTATTSKNLIYVIYTSGTTGNPKGALIRHYSVVNLAYSQADVFGLRTNNSQNCLQFAELVFDASVSEIFCSCLFGHQLYITTENQKKDLRKLNNLLTEKQIHVITLPPSLLNTGKISARNLKTLVVAGEIPSKATLDKYFELGIKVINAYGPTETTVCASLNFYIKNGHTNIGKPLANVKLYILTPNFKPAPYGVTGELYIGGAGIAQGYLHQAKLTAEKFIINPYQTKREKLYNKNSILYKTGDMVRLCPDESIEYIGRNDRQIKIKSYRIELGEIENTLLTYPGIKQGIAVIKEYLNKNSNIINNKYIAIYYVADKEIEQNKLYDFFTQHLPIYMVPAAIIYLKQLPLTINGKIDIKSLPTPVFATNDNYKAPSNEREQLICQAFAETIGLTKVGVNDDFFRLGGDSLLAIRLVSMLQSNFNISIANIFNLKTPKKLAEAENISLSKGFIKHKLEKIKLFYQNKDLQNTRNADPQDTNTQRKITDYFKNIYKCSTDYTLLKPIHNILLTGASGFLGCNLLNQLLTTTNYHIYLLIRANSLSEAIDYINNKYQFYFDKSLNEELNKRIFVFQSDIEKNNLGLSWDKYQLLTKQIDSIIHCAALVKLHGDYNQLESANVQATINLLELSKLTKLKDFHYVSTYSVLSSKFVTKNKNYPYTEDDLPDKLDKYDNDTYIKTKLLGEQQVIKYRKYGINSNIYRAGNLAFMSNNHLVQENIEDNSFFNWLRYIFVVKYAAKEITTVNITPTDHAALAIIKLFDKNSLNNGIYHIFNPFLFDVAEVFTDDDSLVINIFSIDDFINKISQHLNDNIYRDLVINFLLHQGWLDSNDDFSTISNKILQDRTRYILKQMNFEWQPISNKLFGSYIKKVIKPSILGYMDRMVQRKKIFEHLKRVAQIIPTPTYWLDIKQHYLGVNKLVIQGVGAISFEQDFANKTPYDLYPQQMADDIVRHHKTVIKNNEALTAFESIKNKFGEIKYLRATIAPLCDDRGIIIGTIGISIDITAEKEAERIKNEKIEIELKLQKTQLQKEEQEKFKKIADQVAHDIRSPLASLLIILKSCNTKLDERERVTLREVATGISDITNNLLCKYEEKKTKTQISEKPQPILVSLCLLQVLSEKREQYKRLPIKFCHYFVQQCSFISIYIEYSAFKRMLSNLINNSADSLEGKAGEISIKLTINNKYVKISIQDNGKGMTREVINKIMNNINITSGKKYGHGIGFEQIRETLQRNQGKFTINSKIGKGTNITLAFPITIPPEWLATRIELNKKDIVIILDDDTSIHKAWDARFKKCKNDILLKHFTHGQKVIDFVNTIYPKQQIVLLADFELLRQKFNGLQIINKVNVKRSILVTSHYNNLEICKLAVKNKIKILPKQFASEISIVIRTNK